MSIWRSTGRRWSVSAPERSGQADVYEDQTVARGGSGQIRGRAGFGPPHARAPDDETGRGKEVIDAHVPRPWIIGPVGSIERRRSLVGGVCAALLRRRYCPRAFGAEVLKARVTQKRVERVGAPVAVQRVEVRVAKEHEGRGGRGEGQVTVEKLRPEGRLVVVAPPVAVLRPVENGRRRRPGEKHDLPARWQFHRHGPVPGGGQPLHRRGRVRQARPTHEIPRKVAPEKGGIVRRLAERQP